LKLNQIFIVIKTFKSIVKCPQPGYDNWITYGNKICYFVSLYSATWHDANDFCHSNNASLLSIHNIITNSLFARRAPLLNSIDNNLINYNKYFWIGMNSMSKRGIYKWSDGTPTEFTRLTRVTPEGKLINQDIYQQGRCVAMYSISTTVTTNIIANGLPAVAITGLPGFWYKADCNSLYGFFCSKNFATPTIIQPTTPPPGNCPTGNRHYFFY
jgi:hypothetical protein